jgi:hypothetical protein
MSETIEITGSQNSNNAKWQPFQGEEIDALIKHKGFVNSSGVINQVGENIIDSTHRILEMCGDPSLDSSSETGLVLGYVQSGKTLSFTSLTAMARDNNFQIVIIIAGTSTPLSVQTYERMRSDLRIDIRYDRKWVIIPNASKSEDRDTIQMKLDQWSDVSYPKERCSTVLITVMKNGNHLRNLADVFRGLDLNKVPTLIIDDESDQASLNTRGRANARAGIGVNEGEASTIYRRINNLRAIFPHHTLLQYTATPQANLFVNILDRLSPNFIKLLTPGDGYTGGNAFFIQNPHLVRRIPNDEIPSNQITINEPPESLLYSLKIFFIGVVADLSQEFRNRTMMVHPSRLTNSQRIFFDWIRNVSEGWVRLLESSDEDEKNELLMEFKVAYNDLNLTVGSSLSEFEILTSTKLIHSIKNTRIIEVNASSGKTPEIRWNDFYSHILIGGQAMDRGFTVEGLTVTYMPRSLATGQVDTTLQRARFFGYKGAYLGFCRVWVDQNNIDAYVSIIEHEEDVRRRLEEYDLNNKHLNEWDRELVKDRILRLTRPNIIYDDLDRDYFGSEWFVIRAPHDSDNLIPFNQSIISEFFNNHIQSFNLDEGHSERTEVQKHLIGEISLSATLQYLLNRLKFTKETESQTFSSLRGLIHSYLNETPDETCLIYAISSNKVGDQIIQKIRERRLNANDEIQQLFQGEQPTRNGTYRKGEIYHGDRNIRNNEKLTIQIHRLKLKDTNGEDILDENGIQIYDDLPSIAIWIPESIGKDIVRQPENIL